MFAADAIYIADAAGPNGGFDLIRAKLLGVSQRLNGLTLAAFRRCELWPHRSAWIPAHGHG